VIVPETGIPRRSFQHSFQTHYVSGKKEFKKLKTAAKIVVMDNKIVNVFGV